MALGDVTVGVALRGHMSSRRELGMESKITDIVGWPRGICISTFVPLGVGDKLSRHGPSAYRTKRQRTIRLMGIWGQVRMARPYPVKIESLV